jgi:3-oxoacyl-[acyl-carrier protein] reductase
LASRFFSDLKLESGAATSGKRPPWGITVKMVSPGWIPTERHAGDSQAAKDAYAAAVPMRHMGEAADVAEAVAYLASDAAKFVTGQRLSVNGGNTLV